MEKYKCLDDVRKRIDLNYYFINELEKNIVHYHNDDEKLECLELIGRIYSEYITGVYSSSFLENEIIKIGNKINFSPSAKPQKGKMLHVMTRAGNAGGHSTIVYNWIQRDKERQYSIAFTDMDYCEIPSFILKSVSESQGNVICLKGTFMEKAKQLLEFSQDFERIILHIHMYDIVPILAYSNKNWHIPVYFYNHADFRFSYGFSIADAVLNLNKFDLEKSQKYRGVEENKNLVLQSPNGGYVDSIVLDERVRDNIILKYRIDKTVKLVVSMGDEFKYQDIINCKFTDFVERLLNKSKEKIQFIIIGPDPQGEKWKNLEKRTNGYARAIGYIDRQEVYGLIKMCDLFIASFPMRASGSGLAEMWGVPHLSLFTTDREKEFFKNNKAESIEELIDKSLDILDGNVEKYKGCCLEHKLTEKEWCNQWNAVVEKYTSHSTSLFEEKRYIETQEYVNCQLMQELASENIAKYLYSHKVGKELEEQLFYLDNRYGMNIYNKLEVLKTENKFRYYSDKHLQLYLMAIKWLHVKQSNKRIEDYLLSKGYHSIAIYGMSYMGETLLEEINQNSIEVRYGIDKRANDIHSSIRIYLPKEDLPTVDVIVNTTTESNEIILEELKNKKVALLALEQILEELLQ